MRGGDGVEFHADLDSSERKKALCILAEQVAVETYDDLEFQDKSFKSLSTVHRCLYTVRLLQYWSTCDPTIRRMDHLPSCKNDKR